MGLFSRRERPVLPAVVIESLADYGSAVLRSRSGHPMDPRYSWDFVGPVVTALRGPGQDRAVQELYDAVRQASDPALAAIGACGLLAEYDPASRDPRYLELLDSVLEYMRQKRYSSGNLTRYEADRWIEVHGDLRSSFDGIVDVAIPGPQEAPAVAEMEEGTSKLLALTGPLPEGNAFYAERATDGTYTVYSERQKSSDDPSRGRYEERELGSFSAVADLLRAVGQMFGTRPYWADDSLEPYFPSRRA